MATPPAMLALVDAFLHDVETTRDDVVTLNEREHVFATFMLIDRVLQRHQFVYPTDSFVPVTLHDGLQPIPLDANAVELLADQPQNAHRRESIQRALVPTFHFASHDILALLYVAAGERLRIPISMVELPPGPDGSHAVYVHWQSDDGELEAWWEPVSARRLLDHDEAYFYRDSPASRAQAVERRAFGVPMSRNEILGYGWILAGNAWARRVDQVQMRDAFRHARQLLPHSPHPLASEAWFLATAPEPELRNPADAVDLATRAMTMWPCPAILDTLAAADASASRWDEAVANQQDAVRSLRKGDLRSPQFRARLESYERHEAFVDAHPKPRSGRALPTRAVGTEI